MITISLDEYGNFEYDDKTPLFIGGLVYDECDDNDMTRREEMAERGRIRAYYARAVSDAMDMAIKEAGEGSDLAANAPSLFTYPEALHSNGDARRDHDVVRHVKEMVKATLPEFITRGTYGGSPLTGKNGNNLPARKGKYHLFVMLKSDEGKKRFLTENANMLANDDYGANRYFHMASSVVNRIIFHNPLYPSGHAAAINIDVATRSTGNVRQLPGNLVDEFTKQAYRPISTDNGGHRYYSIMNSEIYRTLIAQEMVQSDNPSVKIQSFYVKSIQYDPDMSMMEFLYMSDSLCSILGFQLPGNSADDWLKEIINRTDRINPNNENLIFGYDEIDNRFAKAWSCYENRNYFEALSIAFDTRDITGAFAEHYRKTWFPYLEKRITESINPVLFTANVNDLSELIFTNNLDQEKLLYMMRQIEQMVDRVSPRYRSRDMLSSTLYKLYDVGMSAFGYIGETQEALRYYEKSREYAYYVSLDDFLFTNNKMIVCLLDSFEWDKALEIAKANVENQQLVSELKREVLGANEEASFLSEAIALSQLAQVYACKRDPKAEELFRQALGKMIHGTSNYKITQSYLLHYLADTQQKEAFDKEALDYFDGKKSYNKRYEYITDFDEKADSNFSSEYALYVLVRGLFCFHRDEIDDRLWEKLCSMDEKMFKKSGRKISGHPWELTYTYLAILASERNDNDARNKFVMLRKRCISDKGNTIKAIDSFGLATILDAEGDKPGRNAETELLTGFLRANYSFFEKKQFSKDGDVRYNQLQQHFTFMFR